MIHVVLYEPEIPPNTGNIIRLCANTGTLLHLVHPLGFALDDARLQRAGLDYHELANVREHDSLDTCLAAIDPAEVFAMSTRGTTAYSDVDYSPVHSIALLFGPETRGLPDNILDHMAPGHILRIPMLANSRSLNLANAVAVIVFEALRQRRFSGLALSRT